MSASFPLNAGTMGERWRNRLGEILAEIQTALGDAHADVCLRVVRLLTKAKRVFVAGAGRSGLAMRMFAVRMAQCGLVVHVVGDATTPAIGKKDILLIASASGATATMVAIAKKARAAGARIILLSAASSSPLARLATLRLAFPFADRRSGRRASRQFLGTCFEQCLLILGDLLIAEIAGIRGQRESDLARRHANLE